MKHRAKPSGGMGSRGVTRPMPAQSSGAVSSGSHGHGPPYSDARHEMLEQHHAHTLWIYWTLGMLGVWMLLAPFHFGYLNESLWVDPSGGRGVWFSDSTHTALRAWLMTGSDVVCGALLIALAWRALRANRPISVWMACGVGAWLNAAPILFWAPTAASYMNGTLVGMWVIALTILIPGMPNMILYMRMGPAVPPGWTYNPSSWPQRWIMIVTGFLGLVVSRYLAMYQLGYIDDIWDPFFGESTRRVLNSSMSHSLPISDAGLGALAYTFEFLMGFMGSSSRWRTMPWMVTFFGILVIPLGLVHIFLVISQPVVVGEWCTFCLVAAAIMLPMIPLEVDEVIAMGQHVVRSRRNGAPLWTTFWKGGPASEDAREDDRSPALVTLPDAPRAVLAASVWGMSVPWTLALSTLLGIACMALPGSFGLTGVGSDVLHLAGALVVVVAVISMGEVLRVGRWLDLPLGLAIAAVPLFPGDVPTAAGATAVVLGLAIAVLAVPRGPIRESYGSWNRFIH